MIGNIACDFLLFSFLSIKLLQKEPIEQLFAAYKLLDQTINGINLHYMITNLPNGSSVIDHCYTKVRMERLTYDQSFIYLVRDLALQIGKQDMNLPLIG